MSKSIKRPISVLLTVLLVLSMSAVCVIPAYAVGTVYEMEGLRFELVGDDKAVLTGANTDEATLYIPDTLDNGCNVTAIADGAFRGNRNITNVYAGHELEYVGDYAFESCSHLQKVTFERKVGKIGVGCFSMCSSLDDVALHKDTAEIGDGAFFFTSRLSAFKFPKNLETIGKYAFAFSGIKLAVINKKITELPERLFYGCTSLRSITLSKNLKKIGDYAFRDCHELEIDEFPDTLDVIGDYAFENCRFSEVNFNGSEIGEKAFANGYDTIDEVNLSENLKKVEPLAFSETNVKSFVIPDNVKLENGAFAGMGTDAYKLSDSNKSYTVKKGVVYSADGKTLVYFPTKKGVLTGDYEESTYTYKIPSGTKEIAPYAFSFSTGVTKVDMPDTLTEIGDCAFYSAGSVSDVTISDGVKTIGDYAFANISSAHSLKLGSSVETIGAMAFYRFCDEKVTVKIPDSLKKFNPMSFISSTFEMTADKAYKAEDGVLYSGDGKTLLYFPNIKDKSFKLPDGVEAIADRAFVANTETRELKIPDSLKTIGKEALEYEIHYDYGYEFSNFKDGMRLVGNASKGVKEYAEAHNIGVFTQSPSQNMSETDLKGNETAVFTISGADPDELVYSSNDDKIASVSDDGTIKGLSKGTTYITAAAGTTYFKCKVNVTSDSGIEYKGFDDSKYYSVTPKTYTLWREHYISGNSQILDNYWDDHDEAAISAYQGNTYYRAMNGVAAPGSDNHGAGTAAFGEGYEDMIGMINHACNFELSRYNNPDNMLLYSGAKPYASKLIAGEKNTLKNLRAAVGKTFEHAQYISTTLSPEIAQNFYSGGEGVMMIIYADKDALNNLPSGLIAATHSDFEYEQLFAAHPRFEVIDAGVRFYDGSDWGEHEEDGAFQRYVKIRLLGGKDNPDPLPTPEIKLSSAPKNLYVKQTSLLDLSFENSYDYEVTFNSSDKKVAKINGQGKITALKAGTTTITVSNSETETSFKLTVKKPKLNKKSVTLAKGKSFKLKVTGQVGKATFKTSNKKIASVTKSGVIKAKKKGKATVTVKVNGISLKCKVKVK